MSKRFKMIFAIQDEPPMWPSDWEDNLGFESISEPDDVDADEGDGDGDRDRDVEDREGDEEQFLIPGRGKTSTRKRILSTPGPGARSFDVEPEGNQKLLKA